MKYLERKIPRSCKRIWNTGSWFDLDFERSKDIKSVNREKSNSYNYVNLGQKSDPYIKQSNGFSARIDCSIVFH